MKIISEGHYINVFEKNKHIYKINILKDNPEKIKEIFNKNYKRPVGLLFLQIFFNEIFPRHFSSY